MFTIDVNKPFPGEQKVAKLSVSADAAETLALQALAWIAGQDDLLGAFLGASGMSEGDLKKSAGSPEVLGAVLDFLMLDDAWVIGFCDTIHLPYDRVAMARAALPGGQQHHWT